MESTGTLLKGVDLVWWPTLLRLLDEVENETRAPVCSSFTTNLEELPVLAAYGDADACEELTLP